MIDGIIQKEINTVSKKQGDLKITISTILDLLNCFETDKETAILGLSLALEILPVQILNYAVPQTSYMWPCGDYFNVWNKIYTLQEIIEMGLNHKEIEPVIKHSYNFLAGCIYTVRSVLLNIQLLA